jgi:ABC-type Na+ efflux pump permease subunit
MGGVLGGAIVCASVAVEMRTATVTGHVFSRIQSAVGAQLFGRIHQLLLFMICVLVPALTADCIARERREGTLGLLFMTPLTASGIVVGKVLAQVLRALTLWLAVLPLLTIPFLYGGVTWADVAAFFTIELCAGMMCLAAGILASCSTDNRAIAFILAFLLMGVFLGEAQLYQNWRMAAPSMGTRRVMVNGVYYRVATGASAVRVARVAGPFQFATSHPPPRMLVEDFIFAAIILLAALRFAGWSVERSWQDKIPSIRREGWVRSYCKPRFFNRWFARGMRRALERNPIAWLQQYSWKARLSKWGLCLLFVLLECSVIDGNDLDGVSQLLTYLVLIMVAAYTYAGVNGFLQEKKSGALELILVSPISVNNIIFGRVWGLWKQFLPSALVLVGSDIAYKVAIGRFGFNDGGIGFEFWLIGLEVAVIFLTLPVVATCFTLIAKNLLVASVLTVAIVFGPTAIMLFPGELLNALRSLYLLTWLKTGFEVSLFLLALDLTVYAAHAFSALLAYRYLQRSLGRRSYAY